MSAEPIDFAAVKAEHASGHAYAMVNGKWQYRCVTCEGAPVWPCLPYLLAVEVERLAGKVARVEDASRRFDCRKYPDTNVGPECITIYNDPDPCLPCRIRAALADQPEQVQP